MFRLATCDLRGRKVLLVESDSQTAEVVSAAISADGAIIVGISVSVEGAIQIVSTMPVDVVFVHVRFATTSVPLRQLFKPFGAEVAFRAGFDDWFDPEEEIDVDSKVRVKLDS